MSRRTKAEVNLIKEGIYQLCERYRPMTVRQLFYALTVRSLIDKTEQEYKNVVRWAKELRLSGELPWSWLADNTRWMHKPSTYGSIGDILDTAATTYRRQLWDPVKNPNYTEIWLEKDALTGVFYDVTSEFDVPLMPCRGYPSLSFLRGAAQTIVRNLGARLERWDARVEALDLQSLPTERLQFLLAEEPHVTISYFGDFDPSGVDISRSTETRLREFIQELGGTEFNDCFTFNRVAVNLEQIETMGLPTRPTKKSDSRSKNFGHDISVEVDAIDPDQLRTMIRGCINPLIDQGELDRLLEIERQERETLNKVSGFVRANSADELAARLGV